MTTCHRLENFNWCDDQVAFVIAKRDIRDEDWKTDSIRQRGPLKKGAEARIINVVYNFYGAFLFVEEVNTKMRFYVKPCDVELKI